MFADKVLGIVIFLCKFYIYRCKWQEIVPSRNTVLKILKDKHTVKKKHLIVYNIVAWIR